MAIERFWREVSEPFAANGTSNGVITVDDSEGFKVKAEVVISATSLPNLTIEIKDIPNRHTIVVGPKGPEMSSRVDLSLYTTASNSKIVQPRQKRPSIGPGEIDRATYEEEPIVARRIISVDEFGDLYGTSNPIPVSIYNSFVKVPYDDIVLGYDPDTKDLVTATYSFKGEQVALLTLTYNDDGDLTRVQVT